MSEGTAEDIRFLVQQEAQYYALLPNRLISTLRMLEHSYGGLPIDRMQHSLQSATRADADNRSDAYVAAALLHDVGDLLAPWSHGEYAAAILRPYVSERICWVVEHHPIFMYYYYGHHVGLERHARDVFRDHPWFDSCVEFCEEYDQCSFDPTYKTQPLEYFAPLVHGIFGNKPPSAPPAS